MWTVAAYTDGLTGQVSWLDLKVASHLLLNLGEFLQCLCHDDSTINIIIGIITIACIIIIIE